MNANIASPARRLGGYLLDGVYSVIASLVFGLLVPVAQEAGFRAFVLAMGYIVIGIYFWSKGTSPGKASLGMYVVNRQTLQPVGFWTMLLRETLGKFLSGLILSLGYLWILFDDNKQGWHDKLVDTLVVER